MSAELREWGKIRLDIQPDGNPSQTVVAGPFLKGVYAGNCLRNIVGGEVRALFLVEQDPADDSTSLLVQRAHNVGALRRKVRSRDCNCGVQAFDEASDAWL